MTFNELDRFVQRHMEAYRFPGASVAITNRRETLWERQYGFSDLESERPVCPDTRFQQGSITKTLTALALMQLYDKGKFDPQRPVREYLPWLEFPREGRNITGHHLLTHTSGLPLTRDDLPSSPYMARAVRDCTLVDAPGASYHQSEIGFQILWCVLEKLTGKPYQQAIADSILCPLGMRNSDARISHDSRRNLAIGYRPFYDDRPNHSSYPLVRAPWFEYRAGDGCLVSTVGDLAILLQMLLNRGVSPSGESLVSEEAFELMTRPIVERWKDSYYGYGLYVRFIDGHKIIGHGGDMPGFQSMMLGNLDLGVGAIACINGPGSPLFPFRCAMYALALLRAEIEDLAAPEEPPSPQRALIPNAGEYVGEYRGENRDFRISLDDERLCLVHGAEVSPLEKQEKDTMVCAHPDFALYLLRFVRDSAGKVIEVEHGGDVYYAEGRLAEAGSEYPSEWQSYVGHYRMYSPWPPANFRVVLRRGRLFLVNPGTISYGGFEDRLHPLEPGVFQVGSDDSPDRIEFAEVVDGKALRARLSGSWHYRVSLE